MAASTKLEGARRPSTSQGQGWPTCWLLRGPRAPIQAPDGSASVSHHAHISTVPFPLAQGRLPHFRQGCNWYAAKHRQPGRLHDLPSTDGLYAALGLQGTAL